MFNSTLQCLSLGMGAAFSVLLRNVEKRVLTDRESAVQNLARNTLDGLALSLILMPLQMITRGGTNYPLVIIPATITALSFAVSGLSYLSRKTTYISPEMQNIEQFLGSYMHMIGRIVSLALLGPVLPTHQEVSISEGVAVCFTLISVLTNFVNYED